MKYFHAQADFFRQTWAELGEATSFQLSSYARDGIIAAALDNLPPEVTPPFQNWESMLPDYIVSYATLEISKLELHEKEGAECDINLAASAFCCAYTSGMVEYYTHAVFPRRFPGRQLNMMSLKDVPFTALGVITGAYEEAFRLAKAQISAYRRHYYFSLDQYPIFVFIFRLLADYLAEGELNLIGESAKEPIFQALFDRWREPDVSDIEELCLAACDFHTHRCAPGKRDTYHEFDTGTFMLIPIEVLLLFKLRNLLGLENPVLDHPIMATPLGKLPKEVGFRPDGLIAEVRTRMRKDGFDERAIAML